MSNQPTSPTLLDRLKDTADAAAWAKFESVYGDLIVGFCRRRGVQATDADDVRQEVMLKLMKSLKNFAYDRACGRFRDYLFRVTQSVLTDRFGRAGARARPLDTAAEEQGAAGAVPEIESAWHDEWEAFHFRRAWGRVQAGFAAQHVEAFKQLLAGEPVRRVAEMFTLSVTIPGWRRVAATPISRWHELADGERALVMEWIDGRPLDAWADGVRDQPDGLRVIVACVRRACEAIVHAHSRGVIHRDLKPSNIMVESADGGARPRVLDFGLARDATRDEATLTIEGSFAGTPVYAPPEQIDRGLHEADVRADVYAMGAVLYRALTGHEPFEASTLARLFDMIRAGRLEPPSARNPRIDDELASIIRAALQRDPAARYASMAGLADDLGRWLNREAIHAHPPSMTYYARAFVRRHRTGVALASAALMLIAGSAVAASVLAWRLNQERVELTRTVDERDAALRTATAQRDAAEGESRASTSANQFLAGFVMNLAEAGPAYKERLLTLLQRKAREMDESPVRLRPEIDARLRITIARSLRSLGDRAACEAQAKRVIELCERYNFGDSDVDQAHGLIRALRMEAGAYDEVLAELRPRSPAPAPDGSYAPHVLITGDEQFLEALVRSGRNTEAQAYLESLLPPKGLPASQARLMTATQRRLCADLGLKPPGWMADPVAP